MKKQAEKIAQIARETGLTEEEVKHYLGQKTEFRNILEAKKAYFRNPGGSPEKQDALKSWNEFALIEVQEARTIDEIEQAYDLCPDNSSSQKQAIIRWDKASYTEYQLERAEFIYSKARLYGGPNNVFLKKYLPYETRFNELLKVFKAPFFVQTELNLFVFNRLIKLANSEDECWEIADVFWKIDWRKFWKTKVFKTTVIALYTKYASYVDDYTDIGSITGHLNSRSTELDKVVKDRREEILTVELNKVSSAKEAYKLHGGPITMHKNLNQKLLAIWKNFSAQDVLDADTFLTAANVHDTASWEDLESRAAAFDKMFEFADFGNMDKLYNCTKEDTPQRQAVRDKWIDLAENTVQAEWVYGRTGRNKMNKKVFSKWISLLKTVPEINNLLKNELPEKSLLELSAKRESLAASEFANAKTEADYINVIAIANRGSKIQQLAVTALYKVNN